MTTNREEFLKKVGLPLDTSLSTSQMAKISGMPIGALQEVEKRGRGAYANNLASVRLLDFKKNPDIKKIPSSNRLSINQWAKARQYAFLNKSPKVYYGSDNDIRIKYKLQ